MLSAIFAILVDQTASSIAGTALPYLQSITAATPDAASWILTAFNATYYACILLSPFLLARVGRRRLLIFALTAFALVSLALVYTTNFTAFVILRALQGAFQGCIFVPAVVLLFTSLPATALKFAPPAFVLVSLTGATLGTIISGYIADTYNGNIGFLPGAIATLLTALAIFIANHDTDAPQSDLKPDYIGVALSITMFGALQYLSNEGERRNWFDDPSVVIAAIVLAIAVTLFFGYEMYVSRNPHVDLRMFAKHRNLSVGGGINLVVGAIGYSVTVLIGYLELAVGATPTDAGAAVLVRVVTYAIGVPLAFYLLVLRQALDTRAIVRIGVVGTSLLLFAFAQSMTATAEIDTFFGLSLAFGLFFGLMNQPLGALVIGSLPLQLLASGIAIYKLSSPLGSMIAMGLMQTVFDHNSVAIQTRLAGSMVRSRPAIAHYIESHRGKTGGLTSLVVTQAHILAFASSMEILAAALLVVFPLVQLAQVKRPERKVRT